MTEIAIALIGVSPFHPIWWIAVILTLAAFASVVHAGCNRRVVKLVKVFRKR